MVEEILAKEMVEQHTTWHLQVVNPASVDESGFIDSGRYNRCL